MKKGLYFSEGEIVIKKDTSMKSLPCSMATREESRTLQACKPGETLQVNGMFRNTAGNYWYRVLRSDGSYGYIYGRDAKFTTANSGFHYAQSYFTLSGADLRKMNGKACKKFQNNTSRLELLSMKKLIGYGLNMDTV